MANSRVVVTEAESDAARLLIERNTANGLPTAAVVRRIANATRRVVAEPTNVLATDTGSATLSARIESDQDPTLRTSYEDRYPCVCCGHLTHVGPPGTYDNCPVCGWEDDIVGLRWPDLDDGANRLSLIEAQRSYAATGVADPERQVDVRPAHVDEPLDDGFRPVDPVRDNVEFAEAIETPYPANPTALYWWRPTFWRARAAQGAHWANE